MDFFGHCAEKFMEGADADFYAIAPVFLSSTRKDAVNSNGHTP